MGIETLPQGTASTGGATAAKQDSQITQETATAAALGTIAGAAVVTDANGTIQQYLRGLVVRWLNALGGGTAAASLRVNLATDVGLPAGTALIGKVDHPTTGLGHGVKVVAAAGTDEALAASTPAKWALIQAQTDNTNFVAVGASGVDATIATGTGALLAPGEAVPIPCDNLADIFVDALVSGEGVRFMYGT